MRSTLPPDIAAELEVLELQALSMEEIQLTEAHGVYQRAIDLLLETQRKDDAKLEAVRLEIASYNRSPSVGETPPATANPAGLVHTFKAPVSVAEVFDTDITPDGLKFNALEFRIDGSNLEVWQTNL